MIYRDELTLSPMRERDFSLVYFQKIQSNGSQIYATQHPQDCISTQTAFAVDGPGATVVMTPNSTHLYDIFSNMNIFMKANLVTDNYVFNIDTFQIVFVTTEN